MYVEVVPNRGSPPAILLREGKREGSKVRKRTLANLSGWPPAKVEAPPTHQHTPVSYTHLTLPTKRIV